MTMKLPHLLALLALGVSTSALAANTPTSSSDEAGGVSMSAPPNFSMSLEQSSEEDQPSSDMVPPDLSVSAPDDTSSDETSHMSEPPNFSSSEEDQPASSEEDQTSSQEETPSGPPLASADALKLFYDTCTDISGGDPAAYDRANNGGWTPNDQDDVGPYNSIYSGYRMVENFGEIDIWGSVNSFPTQQLGYCRVDFPDADNTINFSDMGKIADLKGRTEDRGDGNIYGTWESSDKKILVIGDRNAGQVEIEYNILLGDKKK
jgi:hypothetical protein